MDAGHKLSILCIPVVVFEKLPGRLLVQGGLGKRFNQEAADHHEYVAKVMRCLPVFLQSVHTHLSRLGDVGVKDLRQEVALWRVLWVVLRQRKLYFECTTLVRSVCRSSYFCNYVCYVVLVDEDLRRKG